MGCATPTPSPGAGQDAILSAARELGAEAARAAASWITDGNDTEESRARKLVVLEEEGPAGLDLPLPDLSGEWADDPTPRSLLVELLGREELDGLGDDAHGELEEAVAQAWEDGRDDAFQDACVAELRRWLPEDTSEEPCTDHGFEVCPDCGNGGVKVTAAGYVPCTRFLTCWADADEWAGGAS